MNNININNKSDFLFFRVWNNNYLRNQILFRIKDTPVRYTDNYNNKNGWPYSVLGRRINYNSIISLEWMLNNNQYEMIKDKCKSNKFILVTHKSIQLLITNCRIEEVHKLVYNHIKKNKGQMVQIDLIKESVLLNSVYSLDLYIKLYKQDNNYEIKSNWEYSIFNSVNSSLMILALSKCNLDVANYLLGIKGLNWFNETELINKIIEIGTEVSGRSNTTTTDTFDNDEIKDSEIKKHLKEIHVEKVKHNRKLSYTVPDEFMKNDKQHKDKHLIGQSLNNIFTKLLCKSYTPLDTYNIKQSNGNINDISNLEKKKKYKKTLDFIFKNFKIQIEDHFLNAFKTSFTEFKRIEIIKIAIEIGYYFQDINNYNGLITRLLGLIPGLDKNRISPIDLLNEKSDSIIGDWFVLYHFNQNKFEQLSTKYSNNESFNQTLYSLVFTNFEIKALQILISKLSDQNMNTRITTVYNDLYVGIKLPNKSNDQVLSFFNEIIQLIYHDEIYRISIPWESMFGNLIKNYEYQLFVLLINELPLFKSKFINWINQNSPSYLTFIFWSPSNQTNKLDISFIDLLYKYYKFNSNIINSHGSFAIPNFNEKQLNEKIVLVNHLVGNYKDKLLISLIELLPNLLQNLTLDQSIQYYSLLDIGNINSVLFIEHGIKSLTIKTIENYLFENILLNQLFNYNGKSNGILNSIISTINGNDHFEIPVFNNTIRTIDYLYSNKLLSKFGNKLAVSIFEKLIETFKWDREINQIEKEHEIISLINNIFTIEQIQDTNSVLLYHLLSISLDNELNTIFKFILNNHLNSFNCNIKDDNDIHSLLNEYYFKKCSCRNQYIKELEDVILLNNQNQKKNNIIKLLLLGEITNLVQLFKDDTINQVNELFNFNSERTFIFILNLINQYYLNLDSFKLIFDNILMQYINLNGNGSELININLLIDIAIQNNRLDIIIYYIESKIITNSNYKSLKSSFLLKFPKSLLKQITSNLNNNNNTNSRSTIVTQLSTITTPSHKQYDKFPIFKFSCLFIFISYILKLCYDKYAPFTIIHFVYLLLFVTFSKYLLNKI